MNLEEKALNRFLVATGLNFWFVFYSRPHTGKGYQAEMIEFCYGYMVKNKTDLLKKMSSTTYYHTYSLLLAARN